LRPNIQEKIIKKPQLPQLIPEQNNWPTGKHSPALNASPCRINESSAGTIDVEDVHLEPDKIFSFQVLMDEIKNPAQQEERKIQNENRNASLEAN
jgi:hypothetical protein